MSGASAPDPLPGLLARLYLGLFVLDGLLQLLALPAPALAGLAGLLRGLLLLATLGGTAAWVLMPSIPLRLWLPACVLGWELGGALPLPAVLLDLSGATVAAAAVHLAVSVPMLALSFTGRDGVGEGPRFALLPSLLRASGVVALLVFGLALQVRLMIWSVELGTAGYVRVDREGLETARTECLRGDKTVHLVGAIHIGEESGYREMMSHVPDGALVLAEGVTDEEGHLGEGFGYDKLAGRLGLVPQRAEGEGPGGDAEGDGRLRVRRADVDVQSFHPSTLQLLGIAGKALAADDPIKQWLSEATTGVAASPETLRSAIDDVLLGRNAHLLSVVDEVLPEEDVLAVPWGALHLRGISEGLEERGFVCGEPAYTRMLRWSTIGQALRRPSAPEK